jgi:tRNA(fMet)-specific endonuclease VapC
MYLLDTNILSELMKKRPNPALLSQIRAREPHQLFTSCVCVMELRYGSGLRDDFQGFWQKLERRIIAKIQVIPISEKEALRAGDILAEMEKAGTVIGMEDVLIAASALANQCIMVTTNVRHFSRIKDLAVENWLHMRQTTV